MSKESNRAAADSGTVSDRVDAVVRLTSGVTDEVAQADVAAGDLALAAGELRPAVAHFQQ